MRSLWVLGVVLLLSACEVKTDRSYRTISLYCFNAPPLKIDSTFDVMRYNNMIDIGYVHNGEEYWHRDFGTCSVRYP